MFGLWYQPTMSPGADYENCTKYTNSTKISRNKEMLTAMATKLKKVGTVLINFLQKGR